MSREMAQNRVRSNKTDRQAEHELFEFMDAMGRYQVRRWMHGLADVFCAGSWVAAGILAMAWAVAEFVLNQHGVWVWWGGAAVGLTLIAVVGALVVTWFRNVVVAVAKGR